MQQRAASLRHEQSAFIGDESSKAAARVILSIDETYFELLYRSLTSAPSAAPLPATVNPQLRISPAPLATPAKEVVELLRCPATFFGSSHPEGWDEQQVRRLVKITAAAPATAAPAAPAASSSRGQRAQLAALEKLGQTPPHRPWLHTVTEAHAKWLTSPLPSTQTNALLALWRVRSLEAAELLAGDPAASDPAASDPAASDPAASDPAVTRAERPDSPLLRTRESFPNAATEYP